MHDLTSGEWVVTDVAAVDEANQVVYFSTRESAIERHLYRVSLDGGPVERITEGAGWHVTVVSPSTGLYVDNWSPGGVADGDVAAVGRERGGRDAVRGRAAAERAGAAVRGGRRSRPRMARRCTRRSMRRRVLARMESGIR
ncbi:MAG: DPP IV N-terminal domain-containing protein [Thermomicrobiales bacterium]